MCHMVGDDGSFFEGLPSLSQIRAKAARPITDEEIAELADPEELNDRLALRLYERYGWHAWPDAEMPDAQRWWLAVEWFENEWLNGGVAQFVVNSGDSVEEILAWTQQGYAMLRLPGMAAVAARILTTVIDERGLRSETAALAAATDQLTAYAERTRVSDFDDEIIECSQQRAEFVRANPTLFAG
jgi:hypothetical protein